MDSYLRVCESAATKFARVGRANPFTAHWGVPDPRRSGTHNRSNARFEDAYLLWIADQPFLSLPYRVSTTSYRQKELDRITASSEVLI